MQIVKSEARQSGRILNRPQTVALDCKEGVLCTVHCQKRALARRKPLSFQDGRRGACGVRPSPLFHCRFLSHLREWGVGGRFMGCSLDHPAAK
jgi:hypothetical protein